MMIHLSQVGQGPNDIRRGIPCGTMKTWTISLLESMNDLGLGLTGRDPPSRTRILLTPMVAFAPCLELKNSRSGVLDVGYVYHSKN
jgi:hypothetical protein